MPAQPAAGSAPSTNNFGAFESAFAPQSAPVPVVSSAPLNPTVQGLQGLSIANASPPSGGAAGSVGSSGGDKYAAFASLDSTPPQETASVNWSGGGGGGRSASGVIDWGGGGSSAAPPKTSSSSGFDWAGGMAKSSPQAFPGTASASATSLGTPSTSSSQLFGSAPFGAQQGKCLLKEINLRGPALINHLLQDLYIHRFLGSYPLLFSFLSSTPFLNLSQ